MHGRSNGKKNRQTTDKKELKKEKGPLIINQSRPASDIQAAISFDSTESILWFVSVFGAWWGIMWRMDGVALKPRDDE
jgi:hypothetical protein